MDNFHIDITCEGEAALAEIFKWVFSNRGHKAVGYSLDKVKGLILYQWAGDGSVPNPMIAFPAPLGPEEAASMAITWLKTADYGKQPDHDGDNGRGWRIYTEGWGMIGSDHKTFLAVQPAWAMYGK